MMTNAQAAIIAAATRFSKGGVHPPTVLNEAGIYLDWLEQVSPDPEPDVQDTEPERRALSDPDLPPNYGYERS